MQITDKKLKEEIDVLASLGGSTVSSPITDTDTSIGTGSRALTSTKGAPSSLEERALKLLGNGVTAEQVAAALGVTAGRISQLLSDDVFAEKVALLRYNNLQAHSERDNAYDSMEDDLLKKLRNALPLIIKPDTILKAISVINAAKRRGQSAPQSITNQQTVVQLILPEAITHKFSVNSDNQVIRVGEQGLETMQSGNLLAKIEEATNGPSTEVIRVADKS